MFSSRSSPKQPKESKASPAVADASLSGNDYLSAKPVKEPSGSLTPGGTRIRRPKFKKRGTTGYNLNVSHDITGIVMLEIASAEDLPKVRNSTSSTMIAIRCWNSRVLSVTRVMWDMDPFVVVSFGKKVFRTRVIRHSLNPQWEEKLLFHVRKHEKTFEVKFAVLDWDKLTGNDQIGEVTLPLSELMVSAPQPDSATGLYAEGVETPDDMKEFVLSLSGFKDSIWESKHAPKLKIRHVLQFPLYDVVL